MNIFKRIKNYFIIHQKNILRIFFVCLSFFIISYFVIQNKLNELKNETRSNFVVIEKYIDSEITNAEHIIYSLASTLLHDFKLHDISRIQEIIDIFDPQLKHPQFPPFAGYKILGSKNEVVALSIKSIRRNSEYKVETDPNYISYIEEIKKEPFRLYVAPIRLTKEIPYVEIIPMGMAMVSNDNKYIGTIITGFLTDKFTMNLNNLSSFLHRINISNLDSKRIYNNANSSLSFYNLMLHIINDKPVTVYHHLTKYPFVIKAQIYVDYLNKTLSKVILFCLGYFSLFLLFIYLFSNADNKLYRRSLKTIRNKLDDFPGKEEYLNKIQDLETNKKLTSEDFANIISNIIDTYHNLNVKFEKIESHHTSNEIENRILQLILTERHYYPNRGCTKHHSNTSELLLNQIKNFINEDNKTLYLSKFLEEIINYCSEYFYELNIVLDLTKNDKEFSFKHVALSEAIFNIFVFIIRIGLFNIDNEKIRIRGFFSDSNKKFPTITVEASIIDTNSIQALGWSSGVSYIYSGLYTIYSLAKENNLFLHIEQIENKIFFILEPISEERYKSAENCILKYIKNIS